MPKLTPEQWQARAEARLSCADHLMQDWTDEPEEFKQGKPVSDFCRKKYEQCLDRSLSPEENHH